MGISLARPIDIDRHPLILKQYILPTPSIDNFYQQIKRCIRLRIPGAITYSLPRFGKSYAIRYSVNIIREDYAAVPVFTFLCHKRMVTSETAFFTNLLEAVKHGSPHTGNSSAKRWRLISYVQQKADAGKHNLVVFFADEAQRLSVVEYEWLRDLHDELERRGTRMITFLVGQHELLHQKNGLREARQMQIVNRFMIDELRFRGLLSVDDIATCLQGYDEACYPEGSKWNYTRFFFPQAYDDGFRLVSQAQTIWDSFAEAHCKAKMSSEIEIPMQYFTRAVEIALSDNLEHDSPEFRMSPALWESAVGYSKFIESQEELREMDAFS